MARRSAYKKSGRWMGLWVLLCLTGVLGLYATMFALIATKLDRKMGGWTIAIAFIPLVVAVGTGLVVMSRMNRRRVQELTARLGDRGFHVSPVPTDAERAEFGAPIAHLLPSLDLRTGTTGIQWFAVQREGTAKARIFEHEFVTGSGKTTQTHYHTVIAWPAGHPELRDAGLATATWFFMSQYSRFVRRGMRPRELKLPEFADVAERWSLTGDAATAARFLTPAVRSALELSPKGETWCMGAGWVCCCFKGSFDVENLERFLSHTRSVLDAVGREEASLSRSAPRDR